MDRTTSGHIIDLLKKYHGSPKPELDYTDTYQLTVAVVLSAQTTDVQVNAVTPALFSRYPGFADLARAHVRDVEKIIHSTGFYHHKARHVIELSGIVMKRFGGILPRERDLLMELPGVGRKSANVILAVGLGIPALPVDTHVLRIANRLGYVQTDDPRKAEDALTSFIPEDGWTSAHLLFIRHGRSLCTARKPRCTECPLFDLCPGRIEV